VITALNSRYICGKVPLMHALIFLIKMGVIVRLATKFSSYYADKPVLTIMIVNAVLGGIADTVAQTLTVVRIRNRQKSGSVQQDEFLSIQVEDLDQKGTNPAHELMPSTKNLPPPFDFERLTRFMAYGFIMSPIQFHWFAFLSSAFPISKDAGTVSALKRVACDQLIFAPFSLACFFAFMTIAEGGGRRAISRKLQDTYIPALRANWMIWPIVQILNFRVVPLQFQIPFVSCVGIAWTAYLSLSNASD